MMAGERGRAFSVLGAREDKYRKPFLLADIGEGITECEIVKWSVFHSYSTLPPLFRSRRDRQKRESGCVF